MKLKLLKCSAESRGLQSVLVSMCTHIHTSIYTVYIYVCVYIDMGHLAEALYIHIYKLIKCTACIAIGPTTKDDINVNVDVDD